MSWLRAHPFTIIFIGAAFVLLIIFVSLMSTSAPPVLGPPVIAVQGGGALENPGISERYPSAATLRSDPTPASNSTTTFVSLPDRSNTPAQSSRETSATPDTPTQSDDEEGADFSIFFPEATAPRGDADLTLSDQLLSELYSFMSTPLITPIRPTTRTPEQ